MVENVTLLLFCHEQYWELKKYAAERNIFSALLEWTR